VNTLECDGLSKELSFLTLGDEFARSKASWNLDNDVGSPWLKQVQWEGHWLNHGLGLLSCMVLE
jgi:hypothetical protein